MVRNAVLRLSIAALALTAVVAAVACGTEPVGVETCRKIEFARCEYAQACDIKLDQPVSRATTDSKRVGECKRFYEDACLHGLVISQDPGAQVAQACVDAINTTPGCDIVRSPESHPACSFLVPPAPPPEVDSGVVDAADAADASTDG